MSEPGDALSQEALDAFPEACALIERGGRIVRVNAAFASLLGSPPETLSGRTFEQFYVDPIESHLSPWRSGAPAGRVQRARLNAPDGSTLEVEIKAAPFGAGGACHLIVLRPQASVAGSSETPSPENTPVEGAYSFDFAAGTGLVSARLEEIATGRSGSGRLAAHDWLALIDETARVEIFEQLKASTHDPNRLHRFSCRMRGADGVSRMMDHQLRVLARGRRGQPIRVSGIASERVSTIAKTGSTSRQALALEAGALSGWEYDFDADIGACTGVANARPAPGGAETFTLAEWRARLHPDDSSRASAAFMGLQFGGTMDETYRVDDGTGGWLVHHTRAERDSLRGRAYGYTRVLGLADIRRVGTQDDLGVLDSEAARSVRSAALTTWTRDIQSGILTVRGPLTERFGLGSGALQVPMEAWFERIHPEDRVLFDPERAGHTLVAEGGELEYRMLDLDNRYVRLRVRGGISEQSADGTPLALSGVIIEVDETDMLRRRLAETEYRLHEAVSATQLCVWSYDFRRERFLMSGPVLAELGFEPGNPAEPVEISLNRWVRGVHKDDLSRFGSAMELALSDEVVEIEYRFRDHAGGYRWLSVRGGTTERDSQGGPLRATGFFIDVTERRELERQLATRERQLAEAVEAGLVGIWSIDHRTGERHARGQILNWMGKPLDDVRVTREDWIALVHPEDIEAADTMRARLAEGGEVGSVDLRMKSPEGWRYVRTEGRPLVFDADGQAIRSAGVMIDVTAERSFAEALHREKARLDAIYQNTPVLLHTIDRDGLTTRVNAHWVERVGFSQEEIIGQPGLMSIHPGDRQHVGEHLIPRAFKTGSLVREPVRLLSKSGEVIETRLSAFVERNAQGEPVAAHGVFEDVTDINNARRELEGYAEELERTNRELNRFATVASHDLQEPLRKIAAFSSLLRRRYQGKFDPEADRSLEFLVDAAGRMRALIDDLLAYSRASSRPLDHNPVDLVAIASEALKGLSLAVEESGARIEIGDLPEVEGDAMLLSLLFQNLLSNAIKYRGEAAPEISVSAERTGEDWTVCVADNGIGIEAKFFDKIFAPFQRLHGREDYAGTGIGLAVCQQAVERHGGRIWLESEPGKGARFYFTLPAGEAQDEAA